MYLHLKMVLWRKINVNTASYVLRDKTDRTNHITSYILKEIRAWMQLNISPAVYDVIVKNNIKDEEKSLTVLQWKTFR